MGHSEAEKAEEAQECRMLTVKHKNNPLKVTTIAKKM